MVGVDWPVFPTGLQARGVAADAVTSVRPGRGGGADRTSGLLRVAFACCCPRNYRLLFTTWSLRDSECSTILSQDVFSDEEVRHGVLGKFRDSSDLRCCSQ